LKTLIFADPQLKINFHGGDGFPVESRDCGTKEEGNQREDHGSWVATHES